MNECSWGPTGSWISLRGKDGMGAGLLVRLEETPDNVVRLWEAMAGNPTEGSGLPDPRKPER